MKKIHKKAQGLSMNTIIIAVIALIVLVVLVLIFAGKMRSSGEETKKVSSGYTTEKCEVAGTGRKCSVTCTGIDYGKMDCTVGTCCDQ